MSSKFIHRLKKRLLIPTLTMLVIVSQIAPLTAQAATNEDIMDFINNSGTEMSIIMDEDAVAAPVKTNKGKHTSSKGSDNVTVGGIYKSSNKKSGYSSDGRTYTTKGVGYLTTKSLSEQHPELKAALEDYFGAKTLFNTGDGYYNNGAVKNERATLWRTLTYKDGVYKALKSKTQRLELGDIAVENGLIAKNSYAASPLVGLFTYYGIINRDDGILKYDNSSTAYLSRKEAALILGRFMHPDSWFSMDMKESEAYDELGNSAYTVYVGNYGNALLLDDYEDGYTKKELNSSMTRLEFIYMLMESYFPDDVQAAKQTKKSVVSIFSDIDKGDYITDSWKKANKLTKESPNNVVRQSLKDGKIGSSTDAVVEAAYKIGILTKDSKGRANLFKSITYKEALVMLTNAGLNVDNSILYNPK